MISVEEYLATNSESECDYLDGEVVERNWGEWDHYVWVLQPQLKIACTATAAQGLRELKNNVLKTESPTLEVPLNEIFA
jgi:hypothetical protein